MSARRPGPPPPRLRPVVRSLAVVVLAWQLAVAVPAQARPGDLDRGFGGGGTVTTDFAGGPDDARALVVQGRQLVAAGLAFNSETNDDLRPRPLQRQRRP